MNLDWVRSACLALPGATEQVQWGNDLVFKVAGKMFAVAALEPGRIFLSFKTTPEGFAELTEVPGVIPAPYLARAQWVALESERALPRPEILRRLDESYRLVVERLPKSARSGLTAPTKPAAKPARRRSPRES
jgi:predicted DNA-binding protein (MmcQ/YjbR family)